jgi:maltose-binding protein MalE
MKKSVFIVAACILVVTLAVGVLVFKPFSNGTWQTSGGQGTLAEEDGQELVTQKKQIIVYTFDKELKSIIEQYTEKHPEFNYEVVCRENDHNFLYDLNHGLQNGDDDKVDLYCVPASFGQWYIKGGYAGYASTYKELGIDVDTALKKAEIPQNIIDAGSNPDGELIALPYKKNINLFMYRRSIAKKVWGTDEPDKIAEVIGAGTGNWDRFMEAAEELKEHNSYILADYRELSGLVETDISPKLLSEESDGIDSKWEEYMDISKQMLENGYIKGSLKWTEEWFEDLEGKTGEPVFGLFIEDYNIEDLSNWLNSTVGDWAVCLPPINVDTGFYTGFNETDYYTGILVNKNSANKDALGPLIEWITLDHTETGLQQCLANGTLYGGKRTVVSGKVLKNTDNSIPLLNGQNLNTVVYEALQIPTSRHNGTGLGLFFHWFSETEMYLRGEKDKQAAIADYNALKLSSSDEQYKKQGLLPQGRLQSLVGTRELNLYSYDMELMYYIQVYIEKHPEFNYKVNWHHAALIDDFCTLSLINKNIQSDSGDVVDIYCVPDAYSHELIKGDYSKHALTYKELGINVDSELEKAEIPQHIIDEGTNPDGEIIALPYMTGANVFMYRRSIARQVWGTDNPNEIAKIIGAGTEKWDNFLEAAQTLKEQDCYIVPGICDISWMLDTGNMFDENKGSNGFFISTTESDAIYEINPMWKEFMDISKRMFDNGYTKDLDHWSEEWSVALNGKGDKPVFGLVLPYEYISTLSDHDYYLEDTHGDWAICMPPFKTRTAFNTGIIVNKSSPNKDTLGPLIKWLTLDSSEEGLQHSLVNDTLFDKNSERYRISGGKRAVVSGEVLKKTDCTVDFLGGQNINPVICEILNKPSGKQAYQGYQASILNSWIYETRACAKGEKDSETATADFLADVQDMKNSYIEIFKEYDILFMLP